MAHSRADVIAAIQTLFPGGSPETILALLDNYGVEPYERERERVQLAILKLSEGGEEKLRKYVSVAKRDYRDVLYWAEYPQESKVDTPEKRKQVRDLFEKLGVDVPKGLKD